MLCSQVMQEDVPDEDAENAGKGGCGLAGNLDVALCRADWHLHRSEYQVTTSPRTLHQELGLILCLFGHHSLQDVPLRMACNMSRLVI